MEQSAEVETSESDSNASGNNVTACIPQLALPKQLRLLQPHLTPSQHLETSSVRSRKSTEMYSDSNFEKVTNTHMRNISNVVKVTHKNLHPTLQRRPSSCSHAQQSVGIGRKRVKVFWDGEGKCFEGWVKLPCCPRTGRYHVEYDDGTEAWEKMSELQFLPDEVRQDVHA